MKKLEYRVMFTTPAFLGNAEQSGQWRTPPFKALLRQWWRMAYAAAKRFQVEVADMRREEGRLFGAAANGTGNRSLIRLRLDRWDVGSLKNWNGLEQQTVHHREVERTKYQVGPHAYLGFGPLDGRGGTKLAKANAAIQCGEAATLSLAFPYEHADLLDATLLLVDRYGTLGGRSRNGWGSISLMPMEGTPALQGMAPLRPWRDALGLDWPHAIGQDDERPLVWQTESFEDWKSLMRRLAEVKIGLRTQFAFPDARAPHESPLDRHWLSYPVTNHAVSDWNNLRLPNSLRFKARLTPDGNVIGVIFHVSCAPPKGFQPDRSAIDRVWQQVHRHLDQSGLKRIPA